MESRLDLRDGGASLVFAAKEMNDLGFQRKESLRLFDKAIINDMLRRTNGNKSKAAIRLGDHRNTLGRRPNEVPRKPPQSVKTGVRIQRRA